MFLLRTSSELNPLSFVTGWLFASTDAAYRDGSGWFLNKTRNFTDAWDRITDTTFRAAFADRPACDPGRGFAAGQASRDGECVSPALPLPPTVARS
jgi:hypothetical protein